MTRPCVAEIARTKKFILISFKWPGTNGWQLVGLSKSSSIKNLPLKSFGNFLQFHLWTKYFFIWTKVYNVLAKGHLVDRHLADRYCIVVSDIWLTYILVTDILLSHIFLPGIGQHTFSWKMLGYHIYLANRHSDVRLLSDIRIAYIWPKQYLIVTTRKANLVDSYFV